MSHQEDLERVSSYFNQALEASQGDEDLALLSLGVAVHESNWMKDTSAILTNNFHGIKPYRTADLIEANRMNTPHLRPFEEGGSWAFFGHMISTSNGLYSRSIYFVDRLMKMLPELKTQRAEVLALAIGLVYTGGTLVARMDWISDVQACIQEIRRFMEKEGGEKGAQ